MHPINILTLMVDRALKLDYLSIYCVTSAGDQRLTARFSHEPPQKTRSRSKQTGFDLGLMFCE